MTQGEFYYLIMVIGAFVAFASVVAYGSWIASGDAPAVAGLPEQRDAKPAAPAMAGDSSSGSGIRDAA